MKRENKQARLSLLENYVYLEYVSKILSGRMSRFEIVPYMSLLPDRRRTEMNRYMKNP